VAVAVSKLRAGSEDYHLRAIGGAEDYAEGVSEAPGRWLGGGCASLGLSGTVDPDDFRHLLVGCDPATGEPLSKMRPRTAGFDITFSPPKSVSVAFGCGGGDVTKAVVEAHEAAVAAAVAYLEPHCSRVRVTVTDDTGQHQEFRPADGHVAAAFTHRTSRAGDPQLHDHVVVTNVARGTEDGRWRALGHHPDLFAHAKTADAIYLAELRHQLTARLAVCWEERDGHMEIAGVDPGLCDLFSKRTHAALDHLAKRCQPVTPRSMHAAIMDTRRAKPAHGDDPGRGKVSWSPNAGDFGVEPSDTAGLHGRWQSEMAAAGFDLDLTEVVLRVEPPKLDPQQIAALGARLAGPEGLTATDVWFDRRAVLRAFCTLPGVSAADASRLADEWLASGEVVSLGVRSQGAAEAFTTRDLLAQEESLLRSAEERLDAGVGVVDEEEVDAVVDGRGLSSEQEQMVRSLTSSGAGVECVVGRAGTGKTFALDAAREAWEAAGHTVIGTATSAAAAGQLRTGRMEATTVARMLLDAHRDGLPAGCVLVVDEAAMTDTRSLASLCRAVEAARGKLVLVGDHRQLGAVAAGGAFAHLVERIGACELTEVRRQTDVRDREDLAEIRSGDVAAGVHGLLSRVGRTTMADGPDAQRAAMAADWCAARSAGHSVLLLGRRRKNVEAMSCAVREARRAAGELGDEELTVPIQVPGGAGVDRRWQPPSRTFSTGDVVLFTANTTGRWKHLKESLPGVFNGAGGTVTAIDIEAGTVSVRLDTTPDEVEAWEALAAKRDAEVATLQAEMADWAQRRDAAGTPAERVTFERRRQGVATKLHNRLTDRAAGVVAVPGRGKLPRPGHTVEVPAEYLQAGNLALSYARTIHTAQGATADVVLVDGDDVQGREAAYVAMSRHRVDVRTYLTSTAPGAVEAETVGRSTLVDRLVERVSKSESKRTATEMLARRRAQKELAATASLGELSSAVAQLEAELAVAARRAPAGRTSEDPVAVARADVVTAEARAAQTNDGRAAHQVWLARQRLAQAEQRAARRPTPSPERAANTDMTARVERLQDLRAAVKLQSRLAVEALAAEGGGGLGPRPANAAERAAWEQAAAATLTYVARWGVQPGQELARDAPAEQRREAERLAEMLGRRAERQQVERERGVSA